MVPFKLNYTVGHVQGILNFTMDVDMVSHFDEWQRSGEDDFYEAQDQWPVELRRARMIPAVDYVQVSYLRSNYIIILIINRTCYFKKGFRIEIRDFFILLIYFIVIRIYNIVYRHKEHEEN